MNHLKTQRYRNRKRHLPYNFTHEHWDFLLEYWNHACAACGKNGAGFWHTLGLDHWIPVSDPTSPGTVPWNIVSLCNNNDTRGIRQMSGTWCCNQEKRNQRPAAWLTAQLGSRKAQAKLREINIYFEATRAYAVQLSQNVSLQTPPLIIHK
jgi:hypothetical protein